MTPEAMRSAWRNDGFFYMRGMVKPDLVRRIEAEVIAAIRADPPEKHPDEIAYLSGSDYYIYPEKRPSATAVNAEDRIAKVFNCHVFGATRAVAQRKDIVDIVAQLLGEPDIDCFQSQFIFKNPGVIGQPWHQDSYYFPFEPARPVVGLWLAVTEATLENGCLHVLPGSHAEPVHEHIPDRRPNANYGYVEIVDHDMAAAVPVLMQPGDLLLFDSHLMHRSTDNESTGVRAAMVYHYASAGTVDRRNSPINDFVPVRRA